MKLFKILDAFKPWLLNSIQMFSMILFITRDFILDHELCESATNGSLTFGAKDIYRLVIESLSLGVMQMPKSFGGGGILLHDSQWELAPSGHKNAEVICSWPFFIYILLHFTRAKPGIFARFIFLSTIFTGSWNNARFVEERK